jgi:hypothetical protein
VGLDKPCDNDTQCQRIFSNPTLRCFQGKCEEEKCKNNSVCPMDSLCIKGNCIEVGLVRLLHSRHCCFITFMTMFLDHWTNCTVRYCSLFCNFMYQFQNILCFKRQKIISFSIINIILKYRVNNVTVWLATNVPSGTCVTPKEVFAFSRDAVNQTNAQVKL